MMIRLFFFLLLAVALAGCGVNTVANQDKSNKISGNFSGCAIGAYVNGLSNLSPFQQMAGRDLAVVLVYIHWQELFPASEVNAIYNNGSVPLLTWEPWITNQLGTLEAIATGSYEAYVADFIQAAKAWGKPLFLRFAHEMNGNWYPWDGWHNGGAAGPERYKQAWISIYNVIADLKADNLTLVWSPNNTNCPAEAWNTIAAYYPGDQYVDWLAIDGYNWGFGQWQTFSQTFNSAYAQLTALSNKPIMIAEFASATGEAEAKADWISAAFSQIKTNYPRIKAFCWFNVNKERDWRVGSSAASETAFRNALQDSYFLDKI